MLSAFFFFSLKHDTSHVFTLPLFIHRQRSRLYCPQCEEISKVFYCSFMYTRERGGYPCTSPTHTSLSSGVACTFAQCLTHCSVSFSILWPDPADKATIETSMLYLCNRLLFDRLLSVLFHVNCSTLCPPKQILQSCSLLHQTALQLHYLLRLPLPTSIIFYGRRNFVNL